MWAVAHASMTSPTIHYTYSVRPIVNRRLNVTPRDVMTHSSLVKCSVVCGWTSWCLSVNVAADGSTCQLLSEEVSDVTSLETAVGWSHLREFSKTKQLVIATMRVKICPSHKLISYLSYFGWHFRMNGWTSPSWFDCIVSSLQVSMRLRHHRIRMTARAETWRTFARVTVILAARCVKTVSLTIIPNSATSATHTYVLPKNLGIAGSL